MNRLFAGMIGIVVFLVGAFAVCMQFAHKLENQNLAIVQSMTGDVTVRKTAGWFLMVCPTITEYPKAGIYVCSTAAKEKDAFKIQFNNKSTADMNCQIGYRIDGASDEKMIALHQAAEGKDETIWKLVYDRVNTIAQMVSSKYDPSDVIGGDKFSVFVQDMATNILHDNVLLERGIDIDTFSLSGKPIPDKDTETQFAKQKEADLNRRLAAAEKIRLEAEKLKVEANYQKEISEQKGRAEAQMAKEVQEQERIKKLAEIAAEQKVSVEKLEKEQMLVKASKELEVAEIQKQTEAKNLEIIKIKADQKIADAQARSKELELSKALSETEKARIELELGKERVKWESIGKALSSMKLPQIMNLGGINGQSQNSLDTLIQTMTLEKLNNHQVVVPKSK